MAFGKHLATLVLILSCLAGTTADADPTGCGGQGRPGSPFSWYVYGGSLGDLDPLAEEMAPPIDVNSHLPIPLQDLLFELGVDADADGILDADEVSVDLVASDVDASTQLGLGGTYCVKGRFALDFGIRYSSGTVDWSYDVTPLFDGIPFEDLSFEGSIESSVRLLSGYLATRYYPARSARFRPWLSVGIRSLSMRPDDGRFPAMGDLGEPIALADIDKVDAFAGLGVDFALSDYVDLTVSGEQGLDFGWSAGVRLVWKVGGGGCGRRCPKAEDFSEDDDNEEDDSEDDDSDEEERCGPFLPGEAPLARIKTPPITDRRPSRLDPAALPDGARAHFPAYDGDRFFVSFPENRPEPGDLAAAILPRTLRAIGFEPGMQALRPPPADGIPTVSGDFAALVQAVEEEAAGAPESLLPGTPAMLDVLARRQPPDAAVDGALEDGLGMSFAELVTDVTRAEIVYPFQQVHDGTPIEHTLVMASRWPGGGVHSLHGSLIQHYSVINQATLASPVEAADRAMREIPGVYRVDLPAEGEGPVLVLLPYGSTPDGLVELRYAYRMILVARFCQQDVPFLLWLDAEDGTLLKLEPLVTDAAAPEKKPATDEPATVGARALVFNGDPKKGTTQVLVQVDPPEDGRYSLQSAQGLNRIDFREDGFDDLDFAVPGDEDGNPNFDQYPINEVEQALCGEGTNKQFQQVHFFASLMRYRRYSLALGVDPVFSLAWHPGVESVRAGCGAWSNMSFGACAGYLDPACPDYSDGTDSLDNCMNFAHDNTVIAHEMGHNVTFELTNRRSFDWCGTKDCALPVGWAALHDLADFWTAHLESNDCVAGWTCKNVGGVDASLRCRSHSEAGGLPRLLELPLPSDPGAPGDRFPEHRRLAAAAVAKAAEPDGQTAYADMQIGAAALWQLQLGMRSKSRSTGSILLAPRFARALAATGFLGSTPSDDDLGIYRYLADLETQLTKQWATAAGDDGAGATAKVTSSFARAGVFLVPYQCLDSDPANDRESCPDENGGDAVIEIDDGDLDDDYEIRGVRHPEVDYLELGGPPPVFHVWTGPAYRFEDGVAASAGPLPCHPRYRVEVSTDPGFAPGVTVDGGWSDVAGKCYDAWSPSVERWTKLQAGGAGTRVYYRVTTRDRSGGSERVSTRPGNGLWTVPAPWAVLTADGRPSD